MLSARHCSLNPCQPLQALIQMGTHRESTGQGHSHQLDSPHGPAPFSCPYGEGRGKRDRALSHRGGSEQPKPSPTVHKVCKRKTLLFFGLPSTR